jgi:hypothetical protein
MFNLRKDLRIDFRGLKYRTILISKLILQRKKSCEIQKPIFLLYSHQQFNTISFQDKAQ